MIEPRPQRILLVDDDSDLLVVLADAAARRRLRSHDRARRPGGPATARGRLAGPDHPGPDDAAHRRPGPGPQHQGSGRPADHRPLGASTPPTARPACSTKWPRTTSPSPTTTRSCGLESSASCDAWAIGSRASRSPLGAEPDARPAPSREPPSPGKSVQLTPTEVAAPADARRQPGRDRLDRDASGARLDGDRERRRILRLGHDAPAPAEGRGRSGQARPPADRSRCGLPPGVGRWRLIARPSRRAEVADRRRAGRPRSAGAATVSASGCGLPVPRAADLASVAVAALPLTLFGLVLLASRLGERRGQHDRAASPSPSRYRSSVARAGRLLSWALG